MSKKNKLIRRFRSKPKDFTFDELTTLLGYLGYRIDNKGKAGGSRVMFVREGYEQINIHKPHNTKTLHDYQIVQILNILKGNNLL